MISRESYRRKHSGRRPSVNDLKERMRFGVPLKTRVTCGYAGEVKSLVRAYNGINEYLTEKKRGEMKEDRGGVFW